MTVSELLPLLNSGGVVALLLLITVGGWKGWYIWRWQFEDLREDRDFWRQATLEGLDAAEKTLDLHEMSLRRRPR